MEGLEDIIELFRVEMSERISRVEEELVKNGGKDIELIYREFHTIKGTSQMLGFSNFSKAAHMVEDVVKPLWKGNMNLPSEFIPRLLKALDVFRKGVQSGEDLTEEDLKKLGEILEGGERGETSVEMTLEIVSEVDPRTLERTLDLADSIFQRVYFKYESDSELLRMASELRSSLMDLYWLSQTVSLSDVLKGFDRLVYEEAMREGKKARLELRIEKVRIKKELAGVVRDSLVHIVKNAVVHGIEPPDVRRELGKSEEGKIEIRAKAKGRMVVVEVEDDGSGIDPERIKRKLEEMGREIPEDEEELINTIFEPFFSTKERADLGGGRGVGLSSVKTFIESIGGKVGVRSRKGEGTVFTIEIPGERVWAEVLVLRRGLTTYAVRLDDVKKVTLRGEGMAVIMKSGRFMHFDVRLASGNFQVLDNEFGKLKNVIFWIDFVGLPVPVFRS